MRHRDDISDLFHVVHTVSGRSGTKASALSSPSFSSVALFSFPAPRVVVPNMTLKKRREGHLGGIVGEVSDSWFLLRS